VPFFYPSLEVRASLPLAPPAPFAPVGRLTFHTQRERAEGREGLFFTDRRASRVEGPGLIWLPQRNSRRQTLHAQLPHLGLFAVFEKSCTTRLAK